MRRPPLHGVLPTAHDMGREHRIIHALGPTDVPVPDALAMLRRRRRDRRAVLRDGVRRGHRAATTTRPSRPSSTLDARARAGELAGRRARGAARGRRRCGRARRPRRRRTSFVGAPAAADGTRQFEQSQTRDVAGVDRVHELLAARIPEQTREHASCTATSGSATASSTPTARSARCSTGRSARSATRCADVGYVLATWAEPGDDASAPTTDNPTIAPGFPTRDELLERYARAIGARPVGRSTSTSRSRSGAWRASSKASMCAALAGAQGDSDVDLDRSGAGWTVARCSPSEHAASSARGGSLAT